jgi:uncharacterized repeat protein (TIGR03803 family)
MLLSISAYSQSLTVIVDFSFGGNGVTGGGPDSGVTVSGGTLYGTTWRWGNYWDGIVFKVNTDGTGYNVLFNFAGTNGANPYAGVILTNGVLYGVTCYGGTNVEGSYAGWGYGAVFRLNTDGSGYSVLKNFAGSDGSGPCGNLVISGNTLYGTTVEGGTNNNGVIFEVNTDGTGYNVLHYFNGTDGGFIYSGLTLSGRTLYGSAGGGTYRNGTLFKINTDGTGFEILYNFSGQSDGGLPNGLILSGNTLYGSTDSSLTGSGNIFSINTNGTGFTVIYTFSYSDGGGPNADGAGPNGLAISGNTLYGNTVGGGMFGQGTLFKVNTDGTEFTVLYTNSSYFGFGCANLALSGSMLYGTTFGATAADAGTVFSLSLPSVSTPPRQLTIYRSGANCVLSWTNTGNYILLQNPNLTSGNWTTNSNPVTTINGTNSVAITPSTGTSFFRLMQ